MKVSSGALQRFSLCCHSVTLCFQDTNSDQTRQKQGSSFLRQDSLKDHKVNLSNLFAKYKLCTSTRLVSLILYTQSLRHKKHVLTTVYTKHHHFSNCTFKQSSIEDFLMGPMRSGCTEAFTQLLIFHFMLSALCTCASPFSKAQF